MSDAVTSADNSFPTTGPGAEPAGAPGGGRHRFKPGNPGFGYRRGAAEKGAASAPVPTTLKDMRHAYGNPEPKDKTQGHRLMRAFLRDDPKGFVTTLTGMEKAFAAGQRGVREEGEDAGQGGLLPDGSSENVEAMIEAILGEATWTVEAERAACADLAGAMGAGPAAVEAIRGRKAGPDA